ncbi:MAG: chloride channel protein [Bacteroidales bacterium]|nr:chloride channel protein [Bacteroidales bacterium]
MKTSKKSIWVKLYRWRLERISDKQFLYILSLVLGITSGLAAVTLKSMVHGIQYLLRLLSSASGFNFLYFFLPMLGITLTLFVIKYVIKHDSNIGVPGVLYSISRKKGKIESHNMFSSMIESALTVGFGGSVGLEGPSIVTGAAYGSNFARIFRLDYKQCVTLIGCGAAGVMAAIFNAPIAAVIFVLEVIYANFSMSSLVPLMLTSSIATLSSYFFLEQDVLFHSVDMFNRDYRFQDVPSFVVLGIITGLISVYFKKMYVLISNTFSKIKSKKKKLLIGGFGLGVILFLFPSLYGEGFREINMSFRGDYSFIFEQPLFSAYQDKFMVVCLLFTAIIFVKVIASSLTFGAGGVGGIFAPSLFIGAVIGLFVSYIYSYSGIRVPESIFVLLGMSGMIAGVLHAPLTGIFLIADITSGYGLFVPLMLVSAISYATVRIFEDTSVYTYMLAKRRELLTHDKDQSVITLLDINKLIETDIATISPNATLRDLVEVIKHSKRNIFPVVDEEGYMQGMIKLDDIRDKIFCPELYDKVDVRTLMYIPEYFFTTNQNMEDVVKIVQNSGHYNFPVIENGKYVGCISRARIFLEYRNVSAFFSED